MLSGDRHADWNVKKVWGYQRGKQKP